MGQRETNSRQSYASHEDATSAPLLFRHHPWAELLVYANADCLEYSLTAAMMSLSFCYFEEIILVDRNDKLLMMRMPVPCLVGQQTTREASTAAATRGRAGSLKI